MKIKKPELLAPAGDLERLKIAVAYGADAVYVGGHALGLRAKAKNFSPDEMEQGIRYAHAHQVKVYVTANIFAHNADFQGMADYFAQLRDMGADGLIVSDLGVFETARRVAPALDIHISTQANTTNRYAVSFWEKLGAVRVNLARELNLTEIAEIRASTNLEIEAFVHGAMCVSYSGRCLLSQEMTGRGANQGECAHPCRYAYHIMEETRPGQFMPVESDERGTYVLSARDLCMVAHLPDLIQAGLDSLKIEGRMKTPHYVGTVVKAYREAIDDYMLDPKGYEQNIPAYLSMLERASHRVYGTGFYYGQPESNPDTHAYIRTYDYIGVVQGYDESAGELIIEQRNKFAVGDEIEFFPAKGRGFSYVVREMYGAQRQPINSAPHAKQIIRLPMPQEDGLRLQRLDMVQMAVSSERT